MTKPIGSIADTPERRLLAGAVGFLEAARVLFESKRQNPFWHPCFVNLGFAAELGLKSYILAKGDRKPRRFGHNLAQAMDRALELDLMPTHPVIADYVRNLSGPFADMSLRYLEGDSADLAELPSMIGAIQHLLRDITEQGPGLAALMNSSR